MISSHGKRMLCVFTMRNFYATISLPCFNKLKRIFSAIKIVDYWNGIGSNTVSFVLDKKCSKTYLDGYEKYHKSPFYGETKEKNTELYDEICARVIREGIYENC